MQIDKDKESDLLRAGIAGASHEVVDRYGAAVKQHYVSYSGVDNEEGTRLQKSLKSIQQQGTNDEYEFSIKQQKAGWAAEVKDTANTNAEKIINGEKTRKTRYDDLPDTSANNQLYDHAVIDENGNVIVGSESQMKFIGAAANDPSGEGNAERALQKPQSKKFRKYLDNDVTIEVPKDEYEDMMAKASEEIEKLQKQIDKLKASGNSEAVAKLEKKIETLKKIKKNLKPSTVSRKEAGEAANTPELSVAKSVIKVSHRAGMQTAKNAAIIAGSVSIVKNAVRACKGEIEAGEAVEEIAKDTATATAVGYGTGFVGATIKGAMQNSSSGYVRALSKTNIPGTIVAVTVSTAKTMKRYFDGEIDGVECLETLGEQGTGMLASSMFAVIGEQVASHMFAASVGQTLIPIPVVGGLIGGMVGYALSSACYGVLTESLKEAKMAHEERLAIEKACEEHIKMIREYRAQMNEIVNEYLTNAIGIFDESFQGIKDALAIGDIDLVIQNANMITDTFGGKRPFESMDDFDEKMIGKKAFIL